MRLCCFIFEQWTDDRLRAQPVRHGPLAAAGHAWQSTLVPCQADYLECNKIGKRAAALSFLRYNAGVLRKIVVVVTALLVLLIGLWTATLHFVAQTYVIPSESMSPTLTAGNRVVANKFTYRFNAPQPGDVIIFKSPADWSIGYESNRSDNTVVRWLQNALSIVGFYPPDENDAIKRIIAVGGQTVECRNSTGLTVDGKPLSEPYLDPATMMVDPRVYPCLGPEFGPVEVPDDRLWVMGDNRTHSADSRVHCTNTPADAPGGVMCTGDPMAGTFPVSDVIGRVSTSG